MDLHVSIKGSQASVVPGLLVAVVVAMVVGEGRCRIILVFSEDVLSFNTTPTNCIHLFFCGISYVKVILSLASSRGNDCQRYTLHKVRMPRAPLRSVSSTQPLRSGASQGQQSFLCIDYSLTDCGENHDAITKVVNPVLWRIQSPCLSPVADPGSKFGEELVSTSCFLGQIHWLRCLF